MGIIYYPSYELRNGKIYQKYYNIDQYERWKLYVLSLVINSHINFVIADCQRAKTVYIIRNFLHGQEHNINPFLKIVDFFGRLLEVDVIVALFTVSY